MSAALGTARQTVTRGSRPIDLLLFATVFAITFAKIRWPTPLGDVYLSDVTASLFILAVVASRVAARDWSVPRVAGVVTVFFGLFLLVYLVGFFNLTTEADRTEYVKGMGKWIVHFVFVVVAVAYLARRSARLYLQTLGWYLAGFAVNAAYGFLQLALVETAGVILDDVVLGAAGIEARGINVFGAVGEETVYRTNALTLDPNHLGVMLVVPILILAALYLRFERGHRYRLPTGLLLAFLVVVELTTLSRSGMLGILAGLLVLAIPYHHLYLRPRFLVPVATVGVVVAAAFVLRTDFFREVFFARTQTEGPGAQLHFEFYTLVAPAFGQHPLFGLGLNTFSTYYEFLTGRTNYGPHSYYVAILTETGVVGVALFLCYLGFLFRRLADLRRLGRGLAAAGDRLAARVNPLAWGLAAALVGTMAGNIFYLTMQMYYFFVLAVLVIAAPAALARHGPLR